MGCRPGIGGDGWSGRAAAPPARALFLDRDGVVNVERGYVHRIQDLKFVPGLFDLCRAASQRGYLLAVVTNQAGIGRGLYGEDDFARLTAWMQGEFQARGLPAPRFYYCPHHPSAGVGDYRRDCPSRKPNPGMLLAARDDGGLDLAGSILVGDKAGDLEAGHRAGVGSLALLGDPVSAGALPHGSVAIGALVEAGRLLQGGQAVPQPRST